MSLLEFLKQNWAELLVLTREHLVLVLVSTALAVSIGVPLGVLLTRRKSLQTPVLGIANILQTVPSLALFGLLIPLPLVGGIGAKTAVIALTVYSFLPVIRNTVTGILSVDAKTREAAVAMGMTDRQILRMIELPLAAPVILTGIRVAVVIAVGVATVAAAVGAGGLGTYIFRGLRQNDNNLLLAGALSSALLALFCDFALGQFEKSFDYKTRAANPRRKYVAAGALALVLAIFGLGFISNFESRIPSTIADQTIRVGSKDFTESVILAEILAQMLEKRGLAVERRFELGGNLAHDALVSNNLDVYPEYTGTAYTAILKHPPVTDTTRVYDETKREYAEKFDLLISPPLGFSNDFAILVRGAQARENGLRTISDAVPLARGWQAGFGQDFMSRADGYQGFAKAYGFDFARQPREMDLSLTYRALAAGQVDIIAGNSTDGLIAALDLFQLADDKKYFPPYQAVYIARRDRAEILREPFEKLNDAVSTDEMRRLNYAVDGEKLTPKQAAENWLKAKGL
ncbi:MAG TPA: ABC transporter permease/substrate-binding protein [Pyrinomonadaceae bacterium]|jgi:osmoprotectant transport system permease protein